MSTPPAKPSSINDETRSMVHNPKLDQILDRYLDDLQNGRACSREALLSKHPKVADELAEYLDGIEMVSGLGVGSDLVPQKLGDFEIIRPIGRGAMGVVYLANQISLKRPVALKVLRYSVSGKQATARFEREAELVATLQHANIVPIYATGKHDNLHFLAMQLIDGPSLSQWSAADDVDRDPITLAKWGAQVARALAHAHQRDVIHRDVKPSNLLKDEDQKIWLTDFGLARRFDDLRMSMTGAMLGTPNYMSPEQASPSRYPIDHRTDIYSLGATLFELLTGRCVFLAETPHSVLAQVLAEEPPMLRDLQPDASRDLETILMKCLEKEPSDRYQTADQLAEDLDAFAQDRSIKARRPNVVERVTRWKRKNKHLVSTAMLAASAALMLLAVSVAAWMMWKDSVTGTIAIASNAGPIVGRLIDDSGRASPTFTIPTEGPLPFTTGDHTLQTWSGGRMGESQRVTIAAGENQKLKTELSQEFVFEERTVQGVPRVLPLGDRDDLLFFHAKGITRMDGRSGKELWTADAETFVPETFDAEKFIRNIQQAPLKRRSQTKEAKVSWTNNDFQFYANSATDYLPSSFAFRTDNYSDNQWMPEVVGGFPDVNADGHQDVLIACRDQAVLLAFNGKNGTLLWHYNAGINGAFESKTIHQPMPLGDIDGDNVEDYGSLFFNYGVRNKLVRSLDVVSGKTGKRIWRRSIPERIFDVKRGIQRPSACQITTFPKDVYLTGQLTKPRNAWTYRQSHHEQNTGTLVPWAGVRIPDSVYGNSGEQILIACGSNITSYDAKTGEFGGFNEGRLLELGFVPALQPRVVPSADKNQPAIGLLLTEIVANADNKKGTKPITRFTMRSLSSGKELWRFDADYQLEWCAGASSFPIIADLNGDGTPEILIGDGTDLENNRPTGLASLQALDARTGKPLWDSEQRAKLRTLDRQIQYALLGPDEDGDGLDDVYVVTLMVKSKSYVFVDILSGITGQRLRTVHNEIPVFRSDRLSAIRNPFFLDTAQAGKGLVLTTRHLDSTNQRLSTAVMSTATGELLNIGDQLEHPVAADGNGDGIDDLFLLKPRVRSKPFRSNQLVSLKAASSGIKFAGGNHAGSRLTLMDDVDRDGVRDLLHAPFGENLTTLDNVDGVYLEVSKDAERRVVSGATGKNLLTWDDRKHFNALFSANGDFDGDGVNDFLAERQSGDHQKTTLILISGATGIVLWQQPSSIRGSSSDAIATDIDGDGQLDLLLFHYSSKDQNAATFPFNLNRPASYRLTCHDGRSGSELWHFEIAPPDFSHTIFDSTRYGSIILDLNDDGHADILCPCFDKDSFPSSVAISGKTGKPIWELPPHSQRNKRTPSGWHANVITSDQDHASVFVSACEGEGKLYLNVFDLNGKLVSKWSTQSSFGRSKFVGYGEDSQIIKMPLAIADGDKRYVGIKLQHSLVVLDYGSETAKETSRIAGKDLILVEDLNGDGKTDGLFFDEQGFVTIELVTGKEILRKPLAWVDSIKYIKHDAESGFLSVRTGDESNQRLKLIDPATLEVQWDLAIPQGKTFAGLLCGGNSAKLSGKARAAGSSPQKPVANALPFTPRALFDEPYFFGGTSAVVLSTSAAQFKGGAKSFASAPRISIGLTPASFVDVNDDPRLVQPLPWNLHGNAMSMFEIDGLDHSLTTLITKLFPIVLGGIVFPVVFVYFMIRRKRWNLQWLLLLPLTFVLPYILFQMPSELGAEYSSISLPVWQAKLWAALKLVPFLIFIGVFAWFAFRAEWKRLLLLSVLAISIPALMSAFEVSSTNLLKGGRFEWYDTGSLWLLWASVWAGGVWIIGIWIIVSTVRFVTQLAKRIFRRPKLATS